MSYQRLLEGGVVEGEVGEEQREVSASRCKLLCTEWINNILLCSTGNYIQYPVISHNRKNIKKNVYAYMYIYTYV